MIPSSTIRSSIHFLKRHSLYDTEKVYEHRRPEWTHIPETNAMMQKVEDIPIQDMRGVESSLDTHGFFCMNLENSLTAEDFQDSAKVMEGYLPQLTEAIKKTLNADRVQIFDFTLRKRHPDYPALTTTGNIDGNRQPAFSAHIDETRQDAERIIKKLNPTEHASLSKLRWQVVIAWKPLRGPVRDWPLAVCDVRTVNPKTDLQACDIIDPDQVSEEYLLHHTPEQKWYYLKDQMPNEVWVMRQTDSDGSIGVPHSAFPHPESVATDRLRESVDVRMLVFYEDRD